MTAKDRTPIIVLACDGLNLARLGSYGSAGARTREFDRLATDSVVFDQYYTNSGSLSTIYDALWFGSRTEENQHFSSCSDDANPVIGTSVTGSLPHLLSQHGYQTLLLIPSELASFSGTSHFNQVKIIEEESVAAPRRRTDQTRIAKMFASVNETIKEQQSILTSGKDNGNTDGLFIWAHLPLFTSQWDFPLSLRAEYQESEEDPLPYDGVEPPFFAETDYNDDSVDLILSFVEAYKAGLTLFDRGIQSVRENLTKQGIEEKTLIIVLGTRGYPLGEHQRVGFPGKNRNRSIPQSLLYSEEIHQPLVIHFPDKQFQSWRCNALCSGADIYQLIGNGPNLSPLHHLITNPRAEGNRCQLVVEEDRQSVNRTLITKQWLLRQSVQSNESGNLNDRLRHELYLHPDDRFEVNEISSRSREELETLLPLLEIRK